MSSVSHRIHAIIHRKGMSIRAFEARAGITQGVLSNAIKRNTDISSTNLCKIIDTYEEFDAHWLLTGEGDMMRDPESTTDEPQTPKPTPSTSESESPKEIELPRTDEFEYVNNDNGGKVPLVHELSFATLDPDDPKSVQADEHYYIKEFRNADFMMRVAGDNMYPKYKPGDLIACRHHCYTNFYQWGKVYALLTCHQGILIGRVFEHHQNKIFVTLKSENPSYPEWEIPIDEIARAAVIIGSISLD